MFDADQHFYEPRDSFTRYIDPEYQQRIFTPAVLSMHDLDRAIALLEWAIDRGARAVILTAGPAGGRSPAHPDFDPFWARVDEAGLVVAFHITDAGYTERRSPEWGLDPRPTFYTQSAFQWMFFYGEGPVQETIAAMIFDNLFGRFPNVRIVTAEYGVEW